MNNKKKVEDMCRGGKTYQETTSRLGIGNNAVHRHRKNAGMVFFKKNEIEIFLRAESLSHPDGEVMVKARKIRDKFRMSNSQHAACTLGAIRKDKKNGITFIEMVGSGSAGRKWKFIVD